MFAAPTVTAAAVPVAAGAAHASLGTARPHVVDVMSLSHTPGVHGVLKTVIVDRLPVPSAFPRRRITPPAPARAADGGRRASGVTQGSCSMRSEAVDPVQGPQCESPTLLVSAGPVLWASRRRMEGCGCRLRGPGTFQETGRHHHAGSPSTPGTTDDALRFPAGGRTYRLAHRPGQPVHRPGQTLYRETSLGNRARRAGL
jgi:hypothetical protein